MPYSKVTYTSDGTTALRTVPFPFLSRTHVSVLLDGAPSTNFSWISDSQIQLNPVPANGISITIKRSTSPGAVLVDFVDGSRLREADLDRMALQVFYLAQESIDAATEALSLDDAGRLNMGSQRIINVANGTAGTDAVNLGQLQAQFAASGNVPTPANPGDNGRFLMANAGTFSWAAGSGFLPLTGGTLQNGTNSIQVYVGGPSAVSGEVFFGPTAIRGKLVSSNSNGEVSIGSTTNHDFWIKSNDNFRVRVAADGRTCFGNANGSTYLPAAFVHSRGSAGLNAITWGSSSGSSVLLDGAVNTGDHVFLDFRQNGSTVPMARIAMRYDSVGGTNADKRGSVIINGGTYNGISTTGGLTVNHVGEVTVPTPTAAGHATTKAYVDTAAASKAASDDAFSWTTKFTNAGSASEFNLVSLYGPGIFRVTTTTGQRYMFIPNGNNAHTLIPTGSLSQTINSSDRVSAEDLITSIEKLRKT